MLRQLRAVGGFFVKFANDWSLLLCGLLAYNFLTALFPLFLGVLAIAGFVLPDTVLHDLANSLDAGLPQEVVSDNGLNLNFYQMLASFQAASKLTAIVSFLGFIWTGANLFSAMENCFSIIFRTRGRDPIRQKLMAIGMVFFFAVLTPLSVVAAAVSGSLPALQRDLGAVPGLGLIVGLGGYLLGLASAFLLFFLTYLIVPNRRMHPAEVWSGALVAAVLFEIVTYVFPVYVGHFMAHAWFGHLVLLLGILAVWFWAISLILLFGAELNSYVILRQRPLDADIAGLVHRAAQQASAPPDTAPGPDGAARRPRVETPLLSGPTERRTSRRG